MSILVTEGSYRVSEVRALLSIRKISMKSSIIVVLTFVTLAGCEANSSPLEVRARPQCDVTSLAEVFRNPPHFFGKRFCGEALAVPDGLALKIFPPSRTIPQERNNVVMFLDETTANALEPIGRRPFRLYLEGVVSGMEECFQPIPPGYSDWTCTPYRYPLDIQVSRFRRMRWDGRR